MNYRIFISDMKHLCIIIASSVITGIAFYAFKSITTSNEAQNFPIDKRLYLQKKYTREEIVNLGKSAIRDHKTNLILVNPVIGEDGFSYEKKSNSVSVLYENRMLKEFIEKYKESFK